MRRYNTYTDEELLMLLDERDTLALQEIYERYWDRLLNEAFKRLDELSLCEEIVQDVLTDLWFNSAKKKVLHLWPYLFASMRYQVFTKYKKINRDTAFLQTIGLSKNVSATDTDTHCLEKDLLSFLKAWLFRQSKRRREIFWLRYLEGLSTKEISEKVGISQNTVQNQLGTVLADIRKLLKKHFLIFLIVWFLN